MNVRHRQDRQVAQLENFYSQCVGASTGQTAELYGADWGDPWQKPLLTPIRETLCRELLRLPSGRSSNVVEIGPGGGRWTQVILSLRQQEQRDFNLVLVDATTRAFELTNAWLRYTGLATCDRWLVCPDGRIPDSELRADLVFSFDVFVHFEIALTTRYLESVARLLHPGGKFLVNFGCAFEPSTPGWVRSDEWFEYALIAEGRSVRFVDSLNEVVNRYYTCDPTTTVSLAQGFGSAFVELIRR